jgi:SAM-dependent methyltransferase
MKEYWESRFSNEGAMWKFEPSDSAIAAVSTFKTENITKVLIPGFGYGRNGRLFIDNGFDVTGIEISQSAIEIARSSGIGCPVHNGSVTAMPFDDEQYDGIFCYAVLHLLNWRDRKIFIMSCFSQLKPGGLMIFTLASKETSLYGHGRYLSKDRYEIAPGLNAFFYDSVSAEKEFAIFGITELKNIEEPVKFMEGEDPVKMIQVTCRKAR